MYHLNIPQPDIVNPGATGIYVDYLDGNKGHSTNIANRKNERLGPISPTTEIDPKRM